MRLRQTVIDFQRFGSRGPGLWKRLATGHDAVAAQNRIDVRQAGIGERVAGVLVDCPIEVVDALAESFGRSLFPGVPSLQIKLIGLGVFRGVFGQPFLLVTRQPKTQLLGDLLGDRFLNGENVGQLAIVAGPPELRGAGNIHQVGLNRESVTALKDSSGKDRANVQVPSRLLRIRFATLVTEDDGAGGDPQARQLGKAIDEALGDPIAQVLGARVGTRVDKGKDRDRVDGAAARPQPEDRGRGERQPDCQRGEKKSGTATRPGRPLLGSQHGRRRRDIR